MIILELFLTLYTTLILGATSIIEAITGLCPREQLAYVQQVQGLPESTGFAGALSSGSMQ